MTTHLVTTLKRQATDIIAQIKKDKKPVLITEYGQPSVYLIDVKSFDAMREKIAVLELLAQGEKAIQEKRTITHANARKMFKKWLE